MEKNKDDLVNIKYWSQYCMEAGEWVLMGPLRRQIAEQLIDARLYEQASIEERDEN